jgi:hypothetical protein
MAEVWGFFAMENKYACCNFLVSWAGTLVIYPRIRENLTMENGNAAASWKDAASYLWIMAEMQGNVANGELPATPGTHH